MSFIEMWRDFFPGARELHVMNSAKKFLEKNNYEYTRAERHKNRLYYQNMAYYGALGAGAPWGALIIKNARNN